MNSLMLSGCHRLEQINSYYSPIYRNRQAHSYGNGMYVGSLVTALAQRFLHGQNGMIIDCPITYSQNESAIGGLILARKR